MVYRNCDWKEAQDIMKKHRLDNVQETIQWIEETAWTEQQDDTALRLRSAWKSNITSHEGYSANFPKIPDRANTQT